MRLGLAAPAKINLYLHVLGRRADGYHRLESFVAFADIHDRLVAKTHDRLSLTVSGDGSAALHAEPPDANLVITAARALAAAAGIEAKAEIHLEKRIPVAAGLGGGSADAAAALRLCARLWRLRCDETELARVGAMLGADIPMCLLGRPCHVGGVGERLKLAEPIPAAALVLVNPGRSLATAEVFRAHRLPWSRRSRPMGAPKNPADLATRLAHRRNDLTAAAVSLIPEIAVVLADLTTAGPLIARMSGSGATCFGLFPDSTAAKAAATEVREQHPTWWVQPATLRIERPEIETVARTTQIGVTITTRHQLLDKGGCALIGSKPISR